MRVNRQGLLGDKKREGRCSGVYFGKCLYEENLRKTVANNLRCSCGMLFRREFLIQSVNVGQEKRLVTEAKLWGGG